jgi:hypothetical protein
LSKKVYIVLGSSDFSEYIDGDQDYHANPTIPFLDQENVRYGQMSYHDIDPNGRYACYRDCVEQLHVLGTRGNSILLGWIAQGSSYYTDDEVGFQRYVTDCRIAQAAGIQEIFHAPLYRMQGKWGNDAILRLHQILNEEPKQNLTFSVRQYTTIYFWDFWENFNTTFWFSIGIGLGLTICGVDHYYYKSRKLKNKNEIYNN